jgi:phosphatidate cytidylyltransferase
MLGWRLGLSAIIIPALILLFYADAACGESAPVLLALCLALGLRSTYELVLLLRPRFPGVGVLTCGICVTALVLSAWLPHLFQVQEATTAALGCVTATLAMCLAGLMALQAWTYREPGMQMETLGANLLIICYVGLMLTVTAQLRWVAGAEAGYLALGSLVVAAKMGDTSAYTFGRLFGKRKMAPWLSPGKTWAGFAGALGGASVSSWAWLHFATSLFNESWQPPAWYWSLLYGAVLGLAGLIGDLCESLIKRDMNQKDAAALMPGFGGVLDLLDSVLYAGPIAFILWKVLPLQTW